jgi:hypothetical protein
MKKTKKQFQKTGPAVFAALDKVGVPYDLRSKRVVFPSDLLLCKRMVFAFNYPQVRAKSV